MKLRNKKTGEIVDCAVYCNGTFYHSVNDVFEEWEDYEEPKQCWYITSTGEVREGILDADWRDERRIGNYFETKEEAEKAVERLRAWKRLKDKRFKFDGYDVAHNGNGDLCGQLFYNAGDYCIEDVEKDLDLLFGGDD